MEQPHLLKDRYNFVYMTTFILGITTLLPWNFFIIATDYWMYKLRDVDHPDQKTSLQGVFSSCLAISAKVPFVVFLLFHAIISHRVSPLKRIGGPLLVCLIVFIVTTALIEVDTDRHQRTFVIATLCSVVVINVAAAFLQGGTAGLAGCFPTNFMEASVNGQAIGGVIASLAQVFSLIGHSSPTNSAFGYFLSSIVIILVTIIFFWIMLNTSFFKHYLSIQAGCGNYLKINEIEESRDVPLLKVFQDIMLYFIGIVLIFWVTLSVYPAVIVLVESVSKQSGSSLTGRLFTPVACFLVFNTADVCGRLIAGWCAMPQSRPKMTVSLCALRVIFIPLFMLCNAHPRTLLPVLFKTDVCYVIFNVIFGLSNGFLCSVLMTQGPQETLQQFRQTASAMLAAGLGLGLMLGSVSSYLFVKLL
ncbi:equilibrative nucleoside transporter 1-like [Tachypleus tridentatus]|uniref:equilibrative nucleoside transporter 1-like n=1 Tax=Tachypleus tridentatus TaxID=6853 RepID=UPI003FD1B1BA